jgi:hypothetical protein
VRGCLPLCLIEVIGAGPIAMGARDARLRSFAALLERLVAAQNDAPIAPGPGGRPAGLLGDLRSFCLSVLSAARPHSNYPH